MSRFPTPAISLWPTAGWLDYYSRCRYSIDRAVLEDGWIRVTSHNRADYAILAAWDLSAAQWDEWYPELEMRKKLEHDFLCSYMERDEHFFEDCVRCGDRIIICPIAVASREAPPVHIRHDPLFILFRGVPESVVLGDGTPVCPDCFAFTSGIEEKVLPGEGRVTASTYRPPRRP